MFWDGWLRERADHRLLSRIAWPLYGYPGAHIIGNFFFFFSFEALRSIQVHSEQNFK